jgi:hypothetical protein
MMHSISKKAFAILVGTSLFSIPAVSHAIVPLVCDLCTIGVVAGLAVSRYLGVDDSVIGVWIGAMIVALVIMTNAYLDKKKIQFKFRDTVIALSYVIFSGASLYYAGVIGMYRNTFFGSASIFADKILISSLVGAAILVASSLSYQWLKAKNGGKAHFPFEKVALPLTALILTSGAFYLITMK